MVAVEEPYTVKVLFFARSRELSGTAESSVELPDAKPVDPLRFIEYIEAKFPKLVDIRGTYTLAINQEYASLDKNGACISPGDEVAIIPPISGG